MPHGRRHGSRSRRWRSSCWCCSRCRPCCSRWSASSTTTGSASIRRSCSTIIADLLTTPATLAHLCQLAAIRRHRLGDHAVPRLQHRLFPGVPRPQRQHRGWCCSCSAPSRSGPPGIIRTIAWIPFLGRNGAFNTVLIDLHVTRPAARLPAVLRLRGDRHLCPPLHPADDRADRQFAGQDRPRLLEAARDAGASRWQTMVNVVIPLSRTGIALGSILVFTQVMGDYFVVKQMSGGQSASIVSAACRPRSRRCNTRRPRRAPWCWCCSSPSSSRGMMRVVDVRARNWSADGTRGAARPFTFYLLAALMGACPAVPVRPDGW